MNKKHMCTRLALVGMAILLILPMQVFAGENPLRLDIDYRISESRLNLLGQDQEGELIFSRFLNTLCLGQDIDDYREVYRFEDPISAAHSLENGYLLVATSKGVWEKEPTGRLFLSKDGAETFQEVLRFRAGGAYSWSIDSDSEGYVFVSEYGYRGKDNNARHIYRSKDFGESFEIVYSPEKSEGYHNHIIRIDREDKNRVYQVIGDYTKHLLISEDRGDSWRILDWGAYHPTSLIDMGDQILFGLDNSPYPGFMIFDKKTEGLKEAYKLVAPDRGSVYSMVEDGDKIYAATMSYKNSQNWDGLILLSHDKGESFQELARVKKPDLAHGIGIETLVVHGGKLYAKVSLPYYVDKKIGKFVGTMRIDLEGK